MIFETLQILWDLLYFVTIILLIPGNFHFTESGKMMLQKAG